MSSKVVLFQNYAEISASVQDYRKKQRLLEILDLGHQKILKFQNLTEITALSCLSWCPRLAENMFAGSLGAWISDIRKILKFQSFAEMPISSLHFKYAHYRSISFGGVPYMYI